MTDPILLIPGLNCSARVFAHQIPALWRFGPVMVTDHREGQTITAMAQAVLAAAPPSFTLLGFSMGGYIALEIMRQAPERVGRLMLVATNARTDTPAQTQKRLARIARVEAGAFEADLREQFPFSVHPARAGDTPLYEAYRQMAEDAGADAFVRHSRAIIARPDQRGLLGRIRCPTLVVATSDDQIMPEEVTDELAAGIPEARLVRIAGAGHLLPIEQPEQLSATLADWLAG